jgi:GAF domain-containing protein
MTVNISQMHVALKSISLSNLDLAATLNQIGQIFFDATWIERVVLYRASLAGTTIWLDSQQKTNQVITLSRLPRHEQLLNNGGMDYENPLLIVALQTHAKPFALLELTILDERLDSNQLDELKELTKTLSFILENVTLRDLINKQSLASQALANCQDFKSLAEVIGKYILAPRQFVTINLFEFDNAGKPLSGRVVASANRKESFTYDSNITLTQDSIHNFFELFYQQDETLIKDIESDPYIKPDVKEWFKTFQVKSSYSVSMYRNGKPYGSVALNDTTQTITITEQEAIIFKNLVTQAANIIESRQLMLKTSDELDESKVLYELLSEFISAETIPDILQALRHTIGQDSRSISFSETDYGEESGEAKLILQYMVDRNGDVQEPKRNALSGLEPSVLQQLISYLAQAGDKLEIIEETDSDSTPLNKMFLAQGIRSIITIPIVENNKRVAQLSVTWEEPRKFEQRFINLLQTIQKQLTLVLQNKQLLAQTQQLASSSLERVNLLNAINELSNLSDLQTSEQQILETSAKILMKLVNVDHVGIVMLNEEQNMGIVVAEYPNTEAVGLKLTLDSYTFRNLLSTRKEVLIANSETDSRLNEADRMIFTGRGIKAMLIMPIISVEGKVIGSIGFDTLEREYTPSPETIDRVYTFTRQLSLTLQKVRLYEDSQRQSKQLRLISTFGQGIQASQDLSVTITNMFETLKQIAAFDYACLYLYDYEQRKLGLIGRSMYNDLTLFDAPQALNLDTNTVILQSWSDFEDVLVPDLENNPALIHPMRGVLRSIISLPVLSGGRAYGVLELGAYDAFVYSNADTFILRQMANQMGVAVDNSFAYSRSQIQAKTKTRANDISNRLQQQADIESIMRVTLEEVGRTLGAKKARIRLGLEPKVDQ